MNDVFQQIEDKAREAIGYLLKPMKQYSPVMHDKAFEAMTAYFHRAVEEAKEKPLMDALEHIGDAQIVIRTPLAEQEWTDYGLSLEDDVELRAIVGIVRKKHPNYLRSW